MFKQSISNRKSKYIYFLILFFIFIILKNKESNSKKKINVDGTFYECKLPKNSFERTRGVRNRVCIFSKADKDRINERVKQKKLRRKFLKR